MSISPPISEVLEITASTLHSPLPSYLLTTMSPELQPDPTGASSPTVGFEPEYGGAQGELSGNQLAAGAIHSGLSALGVSFNILVLMMNGLECNQCRSGGGSTASTVNISFLAMSDLLYSMMSAYYAAVNFLGDSTLLGIWSCWLNGADIALMHINIWGTLALALQRKAAIESGTNYRNIFTLKYTLIIQLLVWTSALIWGSFFVYNFRYSEVNNEKSCIFQGNSFTFNGFVFVVYICCYLVPVILIASYYKRFGKYFRDQIESSRRRAALNCPRTGHQRFTDARNRFLHFYAYATAISVFVCYTPFFNFRLIISLDVMLFKSSIINTLKTSIALVEHVSIAMCGMNSVLNPLFYILLKFYVHPNRALSYQQNQMATPCRKGDNNESLCLDIAAAEASSRTSRGGAKANDAKDQSQGKQSRVFYTRVTNSSGRLYRSDIMFDLSDI